MAQARGLWGAGRVWGEEEGRWLGGGKWGGWATWTTRLDEAASADYTAGTAAQRGWSFIRGHRLEQAAQKGPVRHLGTLATAPRQGPAVQCHGTASWTGRASHSPRRSCWRLLQSRPRTLQGHGEAQPGHTVHGTAGQTGTRLHQYGRTRPASTQLWLQPPPQSPMPQRQQQRTQADESHTRPPPLAAPGGTGGDHRGRDHAGSAGAMSHRWRRRNGLRQQHQGACGDRVRG